MNKKAHSDLQSMAILIPVLILIWFPLGRWIICLGVVLIFLEVLCCPIQRFADWIKRKKSMRHER